MQICRIIYHRNRLTTTGAPTILFLHGILRGRGFERVALHYAPLLRQLLAKSPADTRILVPEFEGLFSELNEEPKSLVPGSVAGPVGNFILKDLKEPVPVIAYSFGAFLLTKLLASNSELIPFLSRVVLVAPVIPKSVIDENPDHLTDLPTQIIAGTKDNLTNRDVDLRRWFPRAEFALIQGGTHYGFFLPSPADTRSASKTSCSQQQREASMAIADFLGWDTRWLPVRFARLRITEVAEDGNMIDLTSLYWNALMRAFHFRKVRLLSVKDPRRGIDLIVSGLPLYRRIMIWVFSRIQ